MSSSTRAFIAMVSPSCAALTVAARPVCIWDVPTHPPPLPGHATPTAVEPRHPLRYDRSLGAPRARVLAQRLPGLRPRLAARVRRLQRAPGAGLRRRAAGPGDPPRLGCAGAAHAADACGAGRLPGLRAAALRVPRDPRGRP